MYTFSGPGAIDSATLIARKEYSIPSLRLPAERWFQKSQTLFKASFLPYTCLGTFGEQLYFYTTFKITDTSGSSFFQKIYPTWRALVLASPL
jgi:hypothetical protein